MLDLALELLQRAAQVPAHGGRRDVLGDPAQEAGARDAVGQAQLDMGVRIGPRAQAPAPTLIDAADRRPGEITALFPLDDLDEAYEHVLRVMQETLDALAAERRLPLIG